MNLKKTLITLSILLSVVSSSFSQAPQQMSYQAVIRNSSGNLLALQSVGIRLSIIQGSELGAVVFSENHVVGTNANGLVSIIIGTGNPLGGAIANINWASGPYFIKTETDVDGGTNYTLTETTQLQSVPYALHAENASSLNGIAVSGQLPAVNNVLTFNGVEWQPGIVAGGGTGASIACTGSNTNHTVRGIGSGNYECTDAVWINSSGYVGIGTTSPSSFHDLTIGTEGFLVNGSTTTSNIAGRLRIGNTSSSTSYELQVDGDSYLTGTIRLGTTSTPDAGGLRANGDIQTAGNFIQGSSTSGTGTVMVRTSSGELRPQSSTIKVKDNVRSLSVNKNKLFSLRPVTYSLKPALGGQSEIGLIAEEVEQVMPELVIYGPARSWEGNTGLVKKDAEGNEIIDPSKQEPYSVYYDRLPVMLLEVIKEQDRRISDLENQVKLLMENK
jgi:hypothetical protein